jgi:hypothetical protein
MRPPAETPQHEVAHRGVDHGLAGLHLVFVVLRQAAEASPSAERPLDDPAMWLHLKALLGVRAFDNLKTTQLQRSRSSSTSTHRWRVARVAVSGFEMAPRGGC